MWQEVREALHPEGLEIVTVALDTGGAAAAGPHIERANPSHPALIDQAHALDALLGMVNVPSGVWIDEQGTIVRGPEPAWPGRSVFRDTSRGVREQALARGEDPDEMPEGGDPYIFAMLQEAGKIRAAPERYLEALRDWVEHGAASRFALTPDEVVERSRPRPPEAALAAAHFELGQHLHRAGQPEDAVPHFREAHRLQPENWTYKRQAWSMVDPLQRPSEQYEGDWLGDVRKVGAESYYEIAPEFAE